MSSRGVVGVGRGETQVGQLDVGDRCSCQGGPSCDVQGHLLMNNGTTVDGNDTVLMMNNDTVVWKIGQTYLSAVSRAWGTRDRASTTTPSSL